jgi:hypothetical protein
MSIFHTDSLCEKDMYQVYTTYYSKSKNESVPATRHFSYSS